PCASLTCSRKNGLNGTVTRVSLVDLYSSSDETRLSASSASTNHANPARRCGGLPPGCSGAPRPSGAGATCQPRLSRDIGGCASLRVAPRRTGCSAHGASLGPGGSV